MTNIYPAVGAPGVGDGSVILAANRSLRLAPLPARRFCSGHTFFVQQSGRIEQCAADAARRRTRARPSPRRPSPCVPLCRRRPRCAGCAARSRRCRCCCCTPPGDVPRRRCLNVHVTFTEGGIHGKLWRLTEAGMWSLHPPGYFDTGR